MVHTFGCGHTMSLFEGFFPNGTAQTRNEQYGDISSSKRPLSLSFVCTDETAVLGNESIQPERQSTKRGLTAPCLERMKVLDQSTLLTVSQQSSSFRLNSLMSFKVSRCARATLLIPSDLSPGSLCRHLSLLQPDLFHRVEGAKGSRC